ncbi:uncharacterized protein PAN0_015c5023 [Moesziomyces antarcticus]|uniref:Uncharacterized protein n=2 Tax=Pseudozyma antarctica TaxID=84753 RepID=A0A5C3FUI7_PSEA2|nr:uncharacterized protein PAN0_015c5023 [Moesziomyces antarcticus]GAK66799.1 hypothetical protein PAN0_015c5023 [Moesziomyces antarcticus]SPO47850.1 uncharacterized protein PSANT_05538 [Moesziomyces antarcticus]
MFPSSGQRSAVPADCSQTMDSGQRGNSNTQRGNGQQGGGQQTAGQATDSRAGDGQQGSGHQGSGHQGSGHQGSQQGNGQRAGGGNGPTPAGRAGAQKVGSVRWALFQSSTSRPPPSQFPANFDASVAPRPLPQPRKIWIRRRTGPVSLDLSVGPDGQGRQPDFGGTDASAAARVRTAA